MPQMPPESGMRIVLPRCSNIPVNPSFAGYSHCKPRTVSGLDHNGIRNPELLAAWSQAAANAMRQPGFQNRCQT
jgi:hypothetical protein